MIKGIDQQSNPEATSSDYIYWGKNGLSNRRLDASLNEPGNKIVFDTSLLDIQFKAGVTKIGLFIILFYKNNSNQDCIAVANEFTSTLTVKVVRTDLNFTSSKPIKARAKFNAKSELIVAFVDGLNTPKYINLDTADPSDSLNFYNLFPINFNADDIQATVLDSGSLLTGTYYGSFQYISKDRTRSAFTTLSAPIYITTIDPTKVSTETKGTNSGLASNKSIKFTFTNVDTSYSKIALAIISKVNGIISQKIVKEISITSPNLTAVYNGTETLSTVTLEELLTDQVRYLTANHIATLEDQLFLADLTAAPSVDFQSVVNKTTVKWNSRFDNSTTFVATSKYKAGNRRTFIHDEVYALYMQFEMLDGTFSEWFHIPGRPVDPTESAYSTQYTGGVTVDGNTPKVFQIQDTCSFSDINPDGTRGGAMGAWQNTNELYPANFPDYAGQQVRHHKFPSVQFQNDFTWNGEATYGINNLDILGLKISNSNIDYTVVKGYRIAYAKRNLNDASVLGMGLTMLAGTYETSSGVFDQNTLSSCGGNFRIDSLNGANDNLAPHTKYIRFNSFDIWQDRPSVENAYLRNYIRLKCNNLATGFNADATASNKEVDYGTVAALSNLSNPQVDLTTYCSNFTKQAANRATKSAVDSSTQIRKLSSQVYVPNNVQYSQGGVIIDNRGLEETVIAKIEGTTLPVTTYGAVVIHSGTAGAEDGTLAEETYLATLKIPKADFFLSFDNQTLVVSPTIFRDQSGVNVLSDQGDGFIGIHSYVSLAPYNKNAVTSVTESIVNFKIHIGVGRHNVNLRYSIAGDYSTYFYSDSGQFTLGGFGYSKYWFWLNPKTSKWNNFQYNKDFSAVNDFETFGIFNRDVANQEDFNFRILRSTKANRENALEDGWKTFKITDYFDTVRDKGKITNLQEWGNDVLIIHHELGLFRTRDKAILQTNITNITLGSGDIFALEPREENPGAGGTQHTFSCLLTPAGYFFVDQQLGNVYVYDGENLVDIGKGLDIFLSENLTCTKDNPLNDDGITFAYDQRNSRMILSHKAVGRSYTLSYDLAKQEWAFAHDYIPDYIFNTRTTLYSFKDNKLYTHNIGEYGNFYGVVYPFYVDYIVNDKSKQEKILASVTWLVKNKNADGSINQSKSITSITVWNDQHCTGKIDIVTNESDSLFVDANTKVKDERWSFDDLNDAVIDPNIRFVSTLLTDSRPIASNIQASPWYDSEPLRGKYFIVRLEYSNIENKRVHLRELIPTLKESTS